MIRLKTAKIIMTNRSRMEIIVQILQVVNDSSSVGAGVGTTKTKIMYKSFLNYIKLKEYLLLLVEGDLL